MRKVNFALIFVIFPLKWKWIELLTLIFKFAIVRYLTGMKGITLPLSLSLSTLLMNANLTSHSHLLMHKHTQHYSYQALVERPPYSLSLSLSNEHIAGSHTSPLSHFRIILLAMCLLTICPCGVLQEGISRCLSQQ